MRGGQVATRWKSPFIRLFKVERKIPILCGIYFLLEFRHSRLTRAVKDVNAQ